MALNLWDNGFLASRRLGEPSEKMEKAMQKAQWDRWIMSCGEGERADGSAIHAFAVSALESTSAVKAGAFALSAMECMPQLASALFARLCKIDAGAAGCLAPTPESKNAFEEAAAMFNHWGASWSVDPSELAVAPKGKRSKMDVLGASRARFKSCAAASRAFAAGNPQQSACEKARLLSSEMPNLNGFHKGFEALDVQRHWVSILLSALEAGVHIQGGEEFKKEWEQKVFSNAALLHQTGAFKRLCAVASGGNPVDASQRMAKALDGAVDEIDKIEKKLSKPHDRYGSNLGYGAAQSAGQLIASHLAHIGQWSLSKSGQSSMDAKVWWEEVFGKDWMEQKQAGPSSKMFKAMHAAKRAPRRHIALCLSMRQAAKMFGCVESWGLGHMAQGAWASMDRQREVDPQMAALYAKLSMELPNEEMAKACLSRFRAPERAYIEKLQMQGFVEEPCDVVEGDGKAPGRRLRL